MLSWDKYIDNEKIFQRLINHLFSVECDSPGFIPSSPYIGADGAWDGRYVGFYPLEKKRGLYSIQQKYTKHSFNKAVAALKPQIKAALKEARLKGVEHLRVATNAELRPEQVVDLNQLNNNLVKTFEVWYRENLSIRIEHQPYLRFLFFQDYQHPALVDSYFYYNNLSIFSGNIDRPSLAQWEQKIQKFICSNDIKILLLYAHGGYGKSHFLKKLFELSRKVDPSRQVWFVRPSLIDRTSIHAEIIVGRKYLLVIDDADRDIEKLSFLLSFMKDINIDIKILMSSRTSGVYLLEQIIKDLLCFEYFDKYPMDNWTKDELVNLLRLVVGESPVKDEEQIIHYYPNPFLIVWIGSSIKGKSISDFRSLRNKFIQDIESDAKKSLDNLVNLRIEHFLFILTSIVPFSPDNSEINKMLCDSFDLKTVVLSSIYERLLTVGILRQSGRTIKFNPDMKGDVYLSHKLEVLEEAFVKKFIFDWIKIVPDNIFSNIGSAARYGGINKVKVHLREILSSWEFEANEINLYERRNRMKFMKDVAILVPEETLKLLMVFYTTSAPKKDSPWGNREFTTDDYGPVILELMRVSTIRKDLLNFIVQIASSIKDGTYGNYKIGTLTSEFVCPLRNSLSDVNSGLTLMKPWVQSDDLQYLPFLKNALSEVLAGSHEVTRSFMDKFEIGERCLKDTPSVRAMRDAAIKILLEMMDRNSLEVKLAALDIFRSLGKTAHGFSSSKDLPLNKKINEEVVMLINKIGSLIDNEMDFRLLSVIEDIFLRFWATQRVGCENCTTYLKRMPRTPEYLIFRAFDADEFVIDDFATIEQEAPDTDRWKWFVENTKFDKWRRTADDYNSIVQELSKTYVAADTITSYLIGLGVLIGKVQSWSAVLFLDVWVRINPLVFKEIRKQSKLWNSISEIFRNQIDSSLASLDNSHLKLFLDEVVKLLPDVPSERINTFLWLIEKNVPYIDWYFYVDKLIEKGKVEWRGSIIRTLYFIAKHHRDVVRCIDFIIKIIDKTGEFDKSMIDDIDFFVRMLKEDIKSGEGRQEILRRMIILGLSKIPKLEWHGQDLLNICTTNIDELLEFISVRIELQNKEEGSIRFDAVPYEGFSVLINAVHTYEDYVKFIGAVLQWNSEDKCRHGLDVQELINPVILAKDASTGEIFHIRYIRESLAKDEFKKVLTCLDLLPFTETTKEIFMEVGERALHVGLEKDISSLFLRKTYPLGGWTSSGGEVPKAYLDLKLLFESLNTKSLSPALTLLIHKCIDAVEGSIKDFKDQHSEYFDD